MAISHACAPNGPLFDPGLLLRAGFCPILSNPGQENVDGDRIGDACECGDADKKGRVNTTDARLIQRCSVGQIVDPAIC